MMWTRSVLEADELLEVNQETMCKSTKQGGFCGGWPANENDKPDWWIYASILSPREW